MVLPKFALSKQNIANTFRSNCVCPCVRPNLFRTICVRAKMFRSNCVFLFFFTNLFRPYVLFRANAFRSCKDVLCKTLFGVLCRGNDVLVPLVLSVFYADLQ